MARLFNAFKFVTFLAVAGTFGSTGTALAQEGDGLRMIWRAETGRPTNIAPVVSGNHLFIIPEDGPLMVFDAKSGAKKWTYAPPSGVWDRGYGADGERVYVCERGGKIVALKIANGAFVWRASLGIDCQRPPHFSNGVMYVSTTFVGPGLPGDTLTGAKLFALDPVTGKIHWSFTSEDYLLQTALRKDNTVYVGGNFKDPNRIVDEGGMMRIYALDAETAAVKWVHESEMGSPKALYATDETVNYVGYQDFIIGLNAADGTQIWKRDTGNWTPSLAGQDGIVYFGVANRFVYAWKSATGDDHWTYKIEGPPFDYLLIKPLFVGDRVYFMSQRGNVHALNLETGELLWNHPTGVISRVGITVSDGYVYMGDINGGVYGYRIKK